MRKMIVVLTGVMIISGLLLATTFDGLTDRIEANRVAALNASLSALFAQGAGDELTFEELPSETLTVYRGISGGQTVGYAARIVTQGYGGPITMLVGLTPDTLQIDGISIVEQVETPGLGGNITREEFRQQFGGLDATEAVTYVKNIEPNREDNEIQALSGATITSDAIVTGINEQIDDARAIIGEQTQ